MKKRVVVTAADTITSNACNFKDYIVALNNGKTCPSTITDFDVSGLTCQIAMHIPPEIKPKENPDKNLALQLIRRSATLLPEDLSNCDIIAATTMGAGQKGQYLIRNTYDPNAAIFKKTEVLDCFSSSLAEFIKTEIHTSGRALTNTDACASGTTAIGIGFNYIAAGLAKHTLIIGANIIFEMPFYGFSALRLLSPAVVAPFDKNRKGLQLGEGIGLLLLEELETAKNRGAKILAEIAGFGASSDAYHITAPDASGKGPATAMKKALQSAGLTPAAIDYINAHGTGTRHNDRIETLAIKQVFDAPPPISSSKSMLGHTLGAAGVLEAIACIGTINTQVMHPTINYQEKDPDCDLDYIPNQARPGKIETVMSNSFGFGGNNSVIIMKKFRD